MDNDKSHQCPCDDLEYFFNKVLDERNKMDSDVHYEHHSFIRQWIEKEQVKAERWEEVKRQVLGWGVIGLIGAVGVWTMKQLHFNF